MQLILLLDLLPLTDNSIETDLLSACGELISSAVLTTELKAQGISSTLLYGKNAGIITNDTYGNALIKKVDLSSVNQAFENFHCVIVPGFQGFQKAPIISLH